MFVTAAIYTETYKGNCTAYVPANDNVYAKVSEIIDYYYGLLRAKIQIGIYNAEGELVDLINYID